MHIWTFVCVKRQWSLAVACVCILGPFDPVDDELLGPLLEAKVYQRTPKYFPSIVFANESVQMFTLN